MNLKQRTLDGKLGVEATREYGDTSMPRPIVTLQQAIDNSLTVSDVRTNAQAVAVHFADGSVSLIEGREASRDIASGLQSNPKAAEDLDLLSSEEIDVLKRDEIISRLDRNLQLTDEQKAIVEAKLNA